MDERMQVLEMLGEGKITSAQAAELLDALGPAERTRGSTRTAQQESSSERRGRKKGLHKLVEARMLGVTPESVREMAELGYPDLTLEELVRFKMLGGTPELLRGLQAAGYDKLGHRQLYELAMHGVTPEYIEQMTATGVLKFDGEEGGEAEAEVETPKGPER